MTWFESLTGFKETSPDLVRQNITVEGETLTSHVNGKVLACGRLETPTLAELRERIGAGKQGGGSLSVREVVANVQDLHSDTGNAGSLFQVASQFNLLEMVSPNITPEHGVGIYEHDHTQGPACAIAAGAGTIYRKYFVPVNGQIGQSEDNQIDCLADLGISLGNSNNRLWQMQNGYVDALQHPSTHPGEQWADMFANYMAGNINMASQAGQRINFSVEAYLFPFINANDYP